MQYFFTLSYSFLNVKIVPWKYLPPHPLTPPPYLPSYLPIFSTPTSISRVNCPMLRINVLAISPCLKYFIIFHNKNLKYLLHIHSCRNHIHTLKFKIKEWFSIHTARSLIYPYFPLFPSTLLPSFLTYALWCPTLIIPSSADLGKCPQFPPSWFIEFAYLKVKSQNRKNLGLNILAEG